MPVRTKAAQLSLGSRQIVEIARALDQGARVLILDEPTSALSTAETESLFAVIDDLKRSGVTIIYISHRLHELLHLGDWFTVLRSGRVVGKPRARKCRGNGLWSVCQGAQSSETPEHRTRVWTMPPYCLTLRGLTLEASSADEAAQAPLHDVSFALRTRRNRGRLRPARSRKNRISWRPCRCASSADWPGPSQRN